MHHAPAVTYPVGRSRFFGGLLLLAWLLGAALVAWWCLGVTTVGWRQWLALLTLPLGAAGAWWSWRGMPVGVLRWDGQRWSFIRPGHEGLAARPARLGVHLDLQRHLLLSLRQDDGLTQWCWAERTSMPERWGDLRRAVYSPARSQAVSDDAPLV